MANRKPSTTLLIGAIIIVIVILMRGNFGFLGSVTTISSCNGNQDCIDCVSQDHYCHESSGLWYEFSYEWANGVCTGGNQYNYCPDGCAYGHCLQQDYGAVCFPDGTKLCKHTYYEESTGGLLCNPDDIIECSNTCTDGECTEKIQECTNPSAYENQYTCFEDSGQGFIFVCNSNGEWDLTTTICGSTGETGKCESPNVVQSSKSGLCEKVGTDTYTCTDSDGGQNKDVKGIVTIKKNNILDGTYTDKCSATAQSVIETYCSGGLKKEITLSCNYLCFDGECIDCLEATEICDGIDNDCDGQIDEGLDCTDVTPDEQAKTLTWSEYYSISNEKLFLEDATCKDVNDCSIKEGYNVVCEKSSDVTLRLANGLKNKCEKPQTESILIGFLLRPLTAICIYKNDITSLYQQYFGTSDIGVCIAESEGTFGKYWDKILQSVGGIGIPAQFVLLVTIVGIILIIFIILNLIPK